VRNRKGPAEGIEVEELPVSGWSLPAGPPTVGSLIDETVPPAPRSTGGRFGGQGKRIATVVGVLAVIGIAVTVVSGSGSDGATPATTTTSPRRSTTTTRPTPTTTPSAATEAPAAAGAIDPADDMRAILAPVPDGFHASSASLQPSVDGSFAPPVSGAQLFVGADATWSAGPWVLITGPTGFSTSSFTHPPTTIDVNGQPGQVGPADIGDEMTAFGTDGRFAVVTTKGLAAGSSTTIAAALTIDGASTSISASALPGMTPYDADATSWWVSGMLDGPFGSIGYSNDDGTKDLWFTIRPASANPGWFEAAPFFLDDITYATVDGNVAIAGTRAGFGAAFPVVVWRTGGRDVSLWYTGMTTDEALAAAASLVVPTDLLWSDEAWQRAEAPEADESRAPDTVDLPVGTANTGAWTGNVSVVNGSASWWMNGSQAGFGNGAPLAPTFLQVGASTLSPGQTGEMYAGAIALVDASVPAATLLITTTSGTTVGGPLAPLADRSNLLGGPRLGAAMVFPWTEGGFTAQLIAADGTVLATQTDGDLG
jgi:hypothetical protein